MKNYLYMSKLIVLFVFSVLSLLGVSCTGETEENDGIQKNNDSEQTINKINKIGSIVSIDGEEFYVIKNTYLYSESESSASIRAAVTTGSAPSVTELIEDSDAKKAVKKFSGAEFIDKYLQEEAKIVEYELLWNIKNVKTVKRETSNKNIASLEDKFPVYQYFEDSDSFKHIATLSQTWTSEFLIGKYLDKSKIDEADRAEVFNSMTESQIRSYDPDQIRIETNNNLYGSDLSKKISITIAYNRDENGNLDFSNVHYHKTFRNFHLINGQEKYAYHYQINPDSEPVSTLRNIGGSYQLYTYSYSEYSTITNKQYMRINAQGDGMLNGSTDPANYFNSIQFYTSYIKAQFGKNSSSDGYKVIQINHTGWNLKQLVSVKINSKETKKDDSTKYTFEEAINTFLSDYIKIAKIEESNESKLLKKVYAKASFPSGADFNKDFIIVSAEIDENGAVIPNAEGFVNKFSDAMEALWAGNYSLTDAFPDN